MLVAVAAVAAVVAAIAAGSRNAGPATRSGAPTWAQVAPIFANKCAGCHTPGGIAPFSLRNAKTAAAYADRILTMTQLGKMPPWMPGHDSPAYLGQSQRLLTPGEKQLIARWVHGGAQIGKGGSVKPVGGGSKAPGTTMTLAPARAYLPKRAVGGLGRLPLLRARAAPGPGRVRNSAVIKPQRSTIVHHVILFEASGANAVDARRLNDASGGNGWTCFGGPGLSETHPTSDSASNDRLGAPPWISAWVPGHTTNDTPSGTGVLVHAGAAIVMQVHYNLIHKAQPDRSRAIIRFAPASDEARRLSRRCSFPAPVELPCPTGRAVGALLARPGESRGDREVRAQRRVDPSGLLYLCGKTLADYPSNAGQGDALSTSCDRRVTRPLRIYGVAGHMHLRGVDIKVELTGEQRRRSCTSRTGTSTGRTLTTSRTPVDAGRGDTIRVSCRFDNSLGAAADRARETLPPRYVVWGEGTTDEMCLGLLQAAER